MKVGDRFENEFGWWTVTEVLPEGVRSRLDPFTVHIPEDDTSPAANAARAALGLPIKKSDDV